MANFAELGLIEPLCKALITQKYTTPTPIQEGTIPHLLQGGDLLGSAQTGTGKTASFSLPILQRIFELGKRPNRREVRALVLTPTRELADQVAASFRRYGQNTKGSCAVVYGGVGYGPQIRALRDGVDVVVATPGRLLDLFNEGHLNLEHIRFLVLDEADRMLDMGFQKDLETIIKAIPNSRQTILFSATMPKQVEVLARKILKDPKVVNITSEKVTANNIDEQVLFVKSENKTALLCEILKDKSVERAIVFTRTKHAADRLTKALKTNNHHAQAIHGDKTQKARTYSLAQFKSGKCRILVATDVAARGIDVTGITHVVNFQLSNEPESYIHRIGRTARAGQSGQALTLCDSEDSSYLRNIEKLLKRSITVNGTSPFFDKGVESQHKSAKGTVGRSKRGGRNSYRSGKGNGSSQFDRSKRFGHGRSRRPEASI